MNKQTGKGSARKESVSVEQCFYGTATVGERGQFVIPAEARAELGIEPGDKLLIMRDPVKEGLMIFKIDAAREFLEDLRRMLDRVDSDEAGTDG